MVLSGSGEIPEFISESVCCVTKPFSGTLLVGWNVQLSQAIKHLFPKWSLAAYQACRFLLFTKNFWPVKQTNVWNPGGRNLKMKMTKHKEPLNIFTMALRIGKKEKEK